MKSLQEYINESESKTDLSANKVQPKTKDELKEIIKDTFEHKQYDLNFIDTSKITDMSKLFINCKYNFDISEWDVSNVTDMNHMFYDCDNFNCDLSKWNVSKVVNMFSTFSSCKKFEGKGLENWDVSKVKDMHSMFYFCNKFDCDLSNWDVSFVSSDFGWTFYRCDKMTIPKWYMRIMNATKYN